MSVRAFALLAIIVIGGCGAIPASPAASAPPSADYATAFSLGVEAYTYGLPLLITDVTQRTMTSVNVSQRAFGPVNQFNHVRTANVAGTSEVVAPGASSLSSIAWLDLAAEPLVLHVPVVTGHHYVLALLDPYTENIVNLADASGTAPGDYVIAGPGQHDVPIPAGAHRISVDYTRVWIIGSTQLKGPDDIAAVNAIQDGYTLTPLRRYGTVYHPTAPATPVTTVTKADMPTGLAFFDTLGVLLAAFPPPAADAPQLARLAHVGIGPGMTPSTDAAFSEEIKRGLADAVAAGPARMKQAIAQLYRDGFAAHAGYLLGGFGRYGTDYSKRAVVATIGLGAFLPQQAIYAMAWSDSAGVALDGSADYVLHLSAAPPSREGWSVTVYTVTGELIDNPLNRHAFTDTSDLVANPDGSIDIRIGATRPATAGLDRNWLPTTSGQAFEVVWRLYAPDPAQINAILGGSGWQPPAIKANPPAAP